MNNPLSVIDVFEFQAVEGNNQNGDPVAITYTSEKRESFTVEVSKLGVALLATNMALEALEMHDMLGLKAIIRKLYPELSDKAVRDFFFELQLSNYSEVGAVECSDYLGNSYAVLDETKESNNAYDRELIRLTGITTSYYDYYSFEAANGQLGFILSA